MVYHSDASGQLKNTQLESVRSAKKSILIMTFTLSDMEMIQAINQKAQEGVKVTVIMNKDHMGTIQANKHPNIELLTRSGEGRYHHKVLVIDQSLTWLGSANFSPDALTTQTNTMTIVHNQELANYLHDEIDVIKGFKQREKKIPPIFTAGGQKVELLYFPHVPELNPLSSPEKYLNNQGRQRILDLINQAKHHLRFFVCVWTDTELAQAAVAAKNRGVNVEAMIWGQADSLAIINQLAMGGVSVKSIGHLPLVHNKMMVVDDSILVNGSANWSKSWFSRNDESYLVVHDLDQQQRDYLDAQWNQIISL